MGKKMGVSDKVADARARKADAKSSAAGKAAKQEEEAYWAKHENPKGRKDVKKEEEERKRQEAIARKAELKRLAAEEEAALAKLGTKKAQPKAPKVTAYQLQLQREAEQRRMAEQSAQLTEEQRRALSEEDYAKLVEFENSNRESVAVDARSVDAALAQLSVSGGIAGEAEDRHPEKRAKAAWQAYYDRELPLLKEIKPGLKLMQYKSMIFEKWTRSPENPRNQAKE